MKLKLQSITALFVLLTIFISAAYGQAQLTFSGGGGSPLTATLENTVTYTLTSDCGSGPYFIFQNVGAIFILPNNFTPNVTGNITYSVNGGAAQSIDRELNSIALNNVSSTDFGFFRTGGTGAPAGSTIVLSPGTVITTTNVSGTPPTGTNVYTTFITNNVGVRCDAAVTSGNPTAAMTSVSGRVTTSTGRGIKGIILSLTDSNGQVRTVATNPFGYYTFADVEVGQTCVLSASGKRYTFSQPVRVLNVNEEANDVNFIADAERRSKNF